MRLTASWKLLPGAAFLALLAGCPLPRHAPPPPTAVQAPLATHEGRPFTVSGADSLLTVLVYRAGTLGSLGHNHVIASHQLSGTVYVPAEVARGSFELHLPVDSLTVDEPALRARQGGSDFPPDVPDSARAGTRHNMLGEALLDAAQFPDITLEALALAAHGPGELTARVQSTVRGQAYSFDVPVHYQLAGDTLTVSAEFALRQSELGLTPFSALLGALQVQDEMHVSVQLSARAAPAR
jgi:polyisoprenoid-binding protein YceI